MAHLVFGSRWHNGLSMMLDPLDEAEARARYEQGLEVSVACGDEPLAVCPPGDLEFEGEQPAAWSLYTELARSDRLAEQEDVAVVAHYDFWGTRIAEYTFRRRDDALFLTEVTEFVFQDTTRFVDDFDWTEMTVHLFAPDGTSTVVERRASAGGDEERVTEHRGSDFTTHWEPVPAWGEWASITRRDRGRPA